MRSAGILLAILALLCACQSAPAAEPQRPNILVLLSDDVGWGEYGFQGAHDIPTPNIDSIARNGVRFSQGYVSGPYCSPTRAGLLTGRYQTRFGHEFNSVANQHGLPAAETTLAERLKALGYATCAVGKWHLGGQPQYRPMRRGFDEFYGTLANTPFFHPRLVDSRISPDPVPVTDPAFYTTDAYAERAVDWLERHKDQPWFLYVPFNAQHAPLQAPQKYLDRFPNVTDERRKLFSAMMSAMDDAVGRIVGKVRDLGQERRTLIVFTSDNGGPTAQTTSRNGGLRGFKASTWEGGVRVPFCMQWTGKIPPGRSFEWPIIQLDVHPTALAAAGAKVERSWKLDGVNLLPYVTGQNPKAPHETLYWRFGQQWAIRHGSWKLVKANTGGPQPLLFNLRDDPGEQKDLSLAEPEKQSELQKKWDLWNAEQAEPIVPKEVPAAQRPGRAARRNRATPRGGANPP